MKDLFDIFPDLPWTGRRPIEGRLREVRLRADLAKRRMSAAVDEQRRIARRTRENWLKKVGR